MYLASSAVGWGGVPAVAAGVPDAPVAPAVAVLPLPRPPMITMAAMTPMTASVAMISGVFDFDAVALAAGCLGLLAAALLAPAPLLCFFLDIRAPPSGRTLAAT